MLQWHFHERNLFFLTKRVLQIDFQEYCYGNSFTFSEVLMSITKLLSVKDRLLLILWPLPNSWVFHLFSKKNEKHNYTFLYILFVYGMVITLASNLFLDDSSFLDSHLSTFLTMILETYWGHMWNVLKMKCAAWLKIIFS